MPAPDPHGVTIEPPPGGGWNLLIETFSSQGEPSGRRVLCA